jgi:putative ABC transport system substrate-binding protein
MKRRAFIAGLGSAAAWPVVARGQQPNQIARIGYLSQESAVFDLSHGDSAAFRDGLRDFGYVEGGNLHVEFRYADAELDRLPALAAELVGLKVDIIVTYSVGTVAARRLTATIPIVQTVGSDLVAPGFATSLAHPGGNVTGATFFNSELMAKRLEVLKETLPSMTRAGVLLVRNHPSTQGMLEAMASAAQALNVAVQPIEVGEPGEFDQALSVAVLLNPSNPVIDTQSREVDDAAHALVADPCAWSRLVRRLQRQGRIRRKHRPRAIRQAPPYRSAARPAGSRPRTRTHRWRTKM